MKVCRLRFDDRLFCREAVLKASYLFLDEYYIHLSYASEHEITVELTAKPGVNAEGIDSRFGNELIAQMVRYSLSVSNKGIKELILGRALYSTCIDMEELAEEPAPEFQADAPDLDSIATDWFEKNEASD